MTTNTEVIVPDEIIAPGEFHLEQVRAYAAYDAQRAQADLDREKWKEDNFFFHYGGINLKGFKFTGDILRDVNSMIQKNEDGTYQVIIDER